MKDLKEFLHPKQFIQSRIYKELKCSKEEALILQELCKNYTQGIPSLGTFFLVSNIFGQENYKYLDYLKEVRHLIELGYITPVCSVFKNNNESKNLQNSLLNLLQTEVCLSEYFLQFLEEKEEINFSSEEAYQDYLAYLKDEFKRVELYQKLSFFTMNSKNNNDLKIKIKRYENCIKDRLKNSKFYNVIAEIFKENALNTKEQIIFLALLKEEYSIGDETSSARELSSLLRLISDDEFSKIKNKSLLEENSKLIDKNLIYHDEYFTSSGEFSKFFFLSDEILQRIVNFKEVKKSTKIRLENAVKNQDIFELIEPNTDMSDVIIPEATKELLENILKQQDKVVLQRLHKWGVKTNKNIEAKIIFYGPAGTGKTMSALSLAKSMKKAILSFDCSKILSKYVGESEQNVRKIFDTYKDIAKDCKQNPILLLNEADQFLSTRIQGGSGSEKMHNQMQNIFLEQIERFEGIIIATTNFLESLDKAFSRRFEYKIEFKKPDFKHRLLIWNKFLPKNAKFDKEFDIEKLAHYNLSGAQIIMIIKNTALKAAISKEGIFRMKDFLESMQKELNSSFENDKIVGFES